MSKLESTLERWLREQLPDDATIISKQWVKHASKTKIAKINEAFPPLPEPYHLLGARGGWAPPKLVDGVEREQFAYTTWTLVDGKPIHVCDDAWTDDGDMLIKVTYTQPVN
jgi:hypothetical protein